MQLLRSTPTRRRITAFVALIAAVLSVAVGITSRPAVAHADSAPAGTISGLQVENVTNPMGVSTATPRLSWTTTWPAIGDAQSSYEIQVFTNSGYSGTATWDSGTVIGGTSRATFPRATPLTGGERYYWRVQATSTSGASTGWSTETAWWSQGLLADADWQGASWISATAEPAPGTNFYSDGEAQLALTNSSITPTT